MLWGSQVSVEGRQNRSPKVFGGWGGQAPEVELIIAFNTGAFAAGTTKINGNVGGLGLDVGLKSFPNRSVNKGGFGGPIVV
jgi:hypothetical protein